MQSDIENKKMSETATENTAITQTNLLDEISKRQTELEEISNKQTELEEMTQQLDEMERNQFESLSEGIDSLSDQIYDLDAEYDNRIRPLQEEYRDRIRPLEEEHTNRIKYLKEKREEMKNARLKLFKKLYPILYRIKVDGPGCPCYYGFFDDKELAEKVVASVICRKRSHCFTDVKVVKKSTAQLTYKIFEELNESPQEKIFDEYSLSL